MRRAVIALVTMCLAAGAAWGASPEPTSSLRGVFAFSGVRSCVQTAPLIQLADGTVVDGFGPAPNYGVVGPGNASTRSAHFSGTLTLDGTGTGALEFRSLQIVHQATNPNARPITVASNTCEVTYGPDANGTFWLDLDRCTAALELGGGNGTVAEVLRGPTPLKLVATPDKHFLQMSDADLMVERSGQRPGNDPNAPQQLFDRICGRNFTAVLVTRDVK